MPLMHSYRRLIAGVVLIKVVSGGRSFLIKRGSKGVNTANYYTVSIVSGTARSSQHTSLMILMAIQLFEPCTNKSKSRGARGRKSCGLRHPSSQTTLMIAAVTLESSSSSSNRSLIFGQAGRSVSGYTKAKRYKVTMVFFRMAGEEWLRRGKRSVSRELAMEGLTT